MPVNSTPVNIVHFGIGSDFGALLTDLARERLLYNGDAEGAVSCICEALIGCSREIAVDVIAGTSVLEVENGGVAVRTGGTPYDYEEFFEERLTELTEDAGEWLTALRDLLENIKEHDTVTVEMPVRLLARHV